MNVSGDTTRLLDVITDMAAERKKLIELAAGLQAERDTAVKNAEVFEKLAKQLKEERDEGQTPDSEGTEASTK